jgi:uncharacterized ion transporter superfamily protein YfcC
MAIVSSNEKQAFEVTLPNIDKLTKIAERRMTLGLVLQFLFFLLVVLFSVSFIWMFIHDVRRAWSVSDSERKIESEKCRQEYDESCYEKEIAPILIQKCAELERCIVAEDKGEMISILFGRFVSSFLNSLLDGLTFKAIASIIVIVIFYSLYRIFFA